MASQRRRLDVELVRRGITASREQAQAEIAAGNVTVGGAPADKAARLVHPGDAIELAGPPARFVSRGGLKLEAALDRFDIDVAGLDVLDVGASTGGFTDCVLQRGATRVTAVDVGHAQLHEKLVGDPRVRNLERTNIREPGPELSGQSFDALVGDLSFISLRLVLPALVSLCRPGAPMVLLVKPQFEAGRREADRGRGVITDPQVWLAALEGVARTAAELDVALVGAMVSPITGARGNVEFLIHLLAPDRGRVPCPPVELGDVVAEALEMRASSWQ